MLDSHNRIVLTWAEASCLEALRSRASVKSQVAVRAGLDLKRANAALRKLAEKGLAAAVLSSPGGRTRWQPTPRGEWALISTEPDPVPRRGPKTRNAILPNTSAHRLLQLLDRPRCGADLAVELGVSRQRIHQNIIRLLALGLIRCADLAHPTRIVARIDDATPLLRFDEERVLSAMPDEDATTIKKVAKELGLATERVRNVIAVLIGQGLVDTSGRIGGASLLRMTPSGAAHAQRDRSSRRAEPPTLPVKSDRVRLVLNYLVATGPARTATIGQDLDIARSSMNALMQYLKRRGLVKKAGKAFFAPHEVTAEGHYVRDEMNHRATPQQPAPQSP